MTSKIINFIFGFFSIILFVQKGSWESRKLKVLITSLISIPIKRFKNIKRDRELVEEQYDEISGTYIKDNYYVGRERFSVVDGQIKKQIVFKI